MKQDWPWEMGILGLSHFSLYFFIFENFYNAKKFFFSFSKAALSPLKDQKHYHNLET